MKDKVLYIVCGVLVIAAAGLGYLYFAESQKVAGLKAENADLAKAKEEVKSYQDSFANINPPLAALSAISDTIKLPNSKTSAVGTADATEIRQKIGDITDPKDKERAEDAWDRFRDQTQLNDLGFVYQVLIENLVRSVENAKKE